MSRPDEPGSELDALLARPTPQPGDEDAPGARSARPSRGRLETWLRGSGAEADPEADEGDGAAGLDTTPGLTGTAPGEWAEPSGDGGSSSSAGEWSDSLGDALVSLPVDRIGPNRYQPRRHFDEETLRSLAESIDALGVLQPVVVRAVADDRFELVAGERRWRAAQRVGMRMIPALVRQTDDQGALEQAIVENLHRQDLNPLEEAAAYRELSADFGLTQDEVARRVGKSRSAVANVLRLLQLAPALQRLLADGELSAGHARALLGLDDEAAQIALAERVLDQELSVRRTEELVRSAAAGASSDTARGRGSGKSVGALEAQMLLEEHLATRVEVVEAGRGGRLVIRFADSEDLERLIELIGVSTPGTEL